MLHAQEIMDRYNDAGYVAKVLDSAKRDKRYILDPLAPDDPSKTQYLVPWELELTADVIFAEERGLDATAEVPDGGALASIMDGPAAPMADNNSMLAGFGMAGANFARLGVEHFNASAPEPDQDIPTTALRGRPKKLPKPKPTPKPNAQVTPMTPLQQAQKLMKAAVKESSDARSYSKQLASLGVSETLAKWLEAHGEVMEKHFASLSALVHADTFDEAAYNDLELEVEQIRPAYADKSELAKASLNVQTRRQKKKLLPPASGV